MKHSIDMSALRALIAQYRDAVDLQTETLAQEDFRRIASSAMKLADALDAGELDEARLAAHAFSRQVSDSYFEQPGAFKALGQEVARLKREMT
jgi:hypothetical protein